MGRKSDLFEKSPPFYTPPDDLKKPILKKWQVRFSRWIKSSFIYHLKGKLLKFVGHFGTDSPNPKIYSTTIDGQSITVTSELYQDFLFPKMVIFGQSMSPNHQESPPQFPGQANIVDITCTFIYIYIYYMLCIIMYISYITATKNQPFSIQRF